MDKKEKQLNFIVYCTCIKDTVKLKECFKCPHFKKEQCTYKEEK